MRMADELEIKKMKTQIMDVSIFYRWSNLLNDGE